MFYEAVEDEVTAEKSPPRWNGLLQLDSFTCLRNNFPVSLRPI